MQLDYKPQLPKNPRPIVMLGAGGIVRDAHLPAYAQAGFEICSIYNRTKARAETLAEQFGIPKVFDSVEEAVAAAPENAVYDIALMPKQFVEVLSALPDGADVLIQKPMGDDWETSLAILNICRKKNLNAAINCQLRYAPIVAATREMINRDMLGELYDLEVRVTVHTPWELFPNILDLPHFEITQHSVHYVDMVRSFCGDPSGVWARTVGHPNKPMASTRSTILMDYGNKLRATITVNHDHNFGSQHQESFIKWEGSKGAVLAQFGVLKDYPHGEHDSFEYTFLKDGEPTVWKSLKLKGSWFPEAFVGPMANLMCFTEGSEPTLRTSVEDTIQTMACVEAAYDSDAQGGAPLREVPQI